MIGSRQPLLAEQNPSMRPRAILLELRNQPPQRSSGFG
jgi:hypothetical protein